MTPMKASENRTLSIEAYRKRQDIAIDEVKIGSMHSSASSSSESSPSVGDEGKSLDEDAESDTNDNELYTSNDFALISPYARHDPSKKPMNSILRKP